MTIRQHFTWHNPPVSLSQHNFICGHSNCGREVGSKEGWLCRDPNTSTEKAWIYLCPACNRPTFFDYGRQIQVPGVSAGRNVEHLPREIADLYGEIRKATGIGSHTAAVLACRKILMHIAVEKNAKKNLGFIDYVQYLVDKHYAPPGSEPWVDKIRKVGNEANHEIKIMSQEHAEELVHFVEMLLKFIYEFPGKLSVPPVDAAQASQATPASN